MLKKETNLENKKIYSFSFDSVEELLSYIEKTPYAKEYWKKESNLLSRNTGDKDFCKFADSASLEEAIDVCRSGDFRDVGKIFEISNQRTTVICNEPLGCCIRAIKRTNLQQRNNYFKIN